MQNNYYISEIQDFNKNDLTFFGKKNYFFFKFSTGNVCGQTLLLIKIINASFTGNDTKTFENNQGHKKF
jgi:hypothetical protein